MSSITLQPGRSELKRLLKMAREQNPPSKPAANSLQGQTAIITGGSSGYGLACAHILPTLGLSSLILAVRSVEKGEKVAAPLRQAYPHTEIAVWELDMLSYNSIQAFAKRCTNLPRVDIAILNAGIQSQNCNICTATGHEETIQVNYLSTALLSILLLPILKPKASQKTPGRLTLVGSALANTAKFPQRDSVPLLPSFDQDLSGAQAALERYSVSKLLCTMIIYKLSQLVTADQVIINTVDPGYSGATGLHGGNTGLMKLVTVILSLLMGRTAEQGAWTYVDAAVTKGQETHGSYMANWEIWPFHKIMYTDQGKQVSQRLWDETLAELEAYGVKEALGFIA